jgi:hypothetical protein
MTQLNSVRHNVYEHCGEKVKRVQADIAIDVYDYFFLHIFCYIHGSRQNIINFFFQRLFEECLEQGIPAVWDDGDADGQRVVAILNRLNFKEQSIKHERKRRSPEPARP